MRYSYRTAREKIKQLANETNQRHWAIPCEDNPRQYEISTIDPRPICVVLGSYVYADPGSIGGVAFSLGPGIASNKPKLRQPKPPATAHPRKHEKPPKTPPLDAISDHE